MFIGFAPIISRSVVQSMVRLQRFSGMPDHGPSNVER
jgi:hypothetical protein